MSKKLILLFAGIGLLAACTNEKKSSADSTSVVETEDTTLTVAANDSAAPEVKGETLAQNIKETAEPGMSAEEIMALLPACDDVMTGKWTVSAFKKKGYKVTTKREFNDQFGEYETYITSAVLTPAPGVKIVFKDIFGGYKLTIDGAPEVLEKYLAAAKSYVASEKKKAAGYNDPFSSEWYAKKSGNTVTVNLAAD